MNIDHDVYTLKGIISTTIYIYIYIYIIRIEHDNYIIDMYNFTVYIILNTSTRHGRYIKL